ncbi:MAG: hypothetical protein LBD43_02905 [Holosporales bacterium]|jgi:hypothetical protein|nr:hypothetical protein [Holosporales bacterium]
MNRAVAAVWAMMLVVCCVVPACDMIPETLVWLNKADFEVDPKANGGKPFVCHIVIAYSKDLYDRLQSMDAKGYFSSATSLEKTYKDSIEIFKFDLIPGRNKTDQSIDLKSRSKAKGAFIYAKYLTPGKFAENVGGARNITVRLLQSNMEVHHDIDLNALWKKTGGGSMK